MYASVVRLMGCNLDCHWSTPHGESRCDESQTWDASRFNLAQQGHRLPVSEIVEQALACHPRLVIVTGGEPMLHQAQPGWLDMLQGLSQRARVEVETNGTRLPGAGTAGWVDQWNVSPKLRASGVNLLTARNSTALEWFASRHRPAVFKFVVTCEADLDEVEREFVKQYSIPRSNVWIMPAGATPRLHLATARDVAQPVLDHGFNLTLRNHVLVWSDEGEPRDG